MKRTFVILGMVFGFVSSAAAQEHPAIERLLTTSYFALPPASEVPSPTLPLTIAPDTVAPTTAFPTFAAPASPAPAAFAFAANSPSAPAAPAEPPQYVQSVHVTYNWQAYFGYTFFRFYEVPGIQKNTNGFNYSMQYYWKSWFGLDGEFAATRNSLNAFNGWFLFGGGGPRFRWSGPRGLELWGHVLFGHAHLTPQTSFGERGAFAYTAGGGADINILRTRWALRVGADMVGSHFFGTYQYSPKAFGGIVYKF
jgi:hypothetical protein